ncbi:patatin-like phospholipase family protein [Candidatus Woesearchaeota archaeon]|nr:patatin-like phospholipase family protein [Candidatus Woesearchaeota archaeon]
MKNNKKVSKKKLEEERLRTYFKSKKVGLVLSGGAAKGLAHIGVLKVLERYGVKPKVIAGNSMGGLVACMYAKSLDIREVEDFVMSFKLIDYIKLFDFTISNTGFFKGDSFKEFSKKFFGKRRFEDLKIPVLINAVNFDTGKQVVISKGLIVNGVRATISLPILFKPVKYYKTRLVDGTLINPMPVDLLKNYNLDLVICSNTLAGKKNIKQVKNINDIAVKSYIIMSNELIKLRLEKNKANFLVEPDLHDINFYDFPKRKKIIRRGEIAAGHVVDEMKKKFL